MQQLFQKSRREYRENEDMPDHRGVPVNILGSTFSIGAIRVAAVGSIFTACWAGLIACSLFPTTFFARASLLKTSGLSVGRAATLLILSVTSVFRVGSVGFLSSCSVFFSSSAASCLRFCCSTIAVLSCAAAGDCGAICKALLTVVSA